MEKSLLNNQIDLLIEEVKSNFLALKNEKNITIEDADFLMTLLGELTKKTTIWLIENKLNNQPKETINTDLQLNSIAQTGLEETNKKEEPELESISIDPVEKNIPLHDIKKLIGFNDKLEFINELFKSNAAHYEQAIVELNNSNNINTALTIFNELKQRYAWQADNESAAKFKELLQNSFK